jgi:hypothetical protein
LIVIPSTEAAPWPFFAGASGITSYMPPLKRLTRFLPEKVIDCLTDRSDVAFVVVRESLLDLPQGEPAMLAAGEASRDCVLRAK